MTTPKEALERIIQIYERNAGRQDEKSADIPLVARRALASLQGEDAVERVARIIDPEAFEDDRLTWHDRRISARTKARAILDTGLVADEAVTVVNSPTYLILAIADIRERTGVGDKPVLNKLADAIVAEMDRRVADEREKCAKRQVISLGDIVAVNENCPFHGDWRGVQLKVVGLHIDPNGALWADVIDGDQRHRGNGRYDGETTDFDASHLSIVDAAAIRSNGRGA